MMAGIGMRGAALAAAALAVGVAAGETFTSVMAAAMARMHEDMAVPSSGSPDRDFAAMMIPHHQGAIDMAEAELRFGHDPELRRLALEIVAAQKREIGTMRAALQRLPAGGAPAQPMPGMDHGSHAR